MSYTIYIHQSTGIEHINVPAGLSLLQALQRHQVPVFAPCGGNGTCGKCRVTVRGEGEVTACLYPVTNDIEVVLPDQREAQVLVEQHTFSRSLPLAPGVCLMLSDEPMGVAIDIGTTTCALYFADLTNGRLIETMAMLNPQGRFGADVISRIQYATHSPAHLGELQKAVVKGINECLMRFCRSRSVPAANIVKIIVAGNNTMLHLLIGADPSGIGLAPYTPQFTDRQVTKGGQLGLTCHPDAEVILLPSVSAYVGADIVAGLASLSPPGHISTYLLMDIGTNGELALVTPTKVWCCATAAGPAFEGATISCGSGAVTGAISQFNENGYQVIGNVKPVSVCGSGLIDVVAHLVRTGLVSSDGNMANEFVLAQASETSTGKAITLKQADIREVQLAKSAIISGVNILLRVAGMSLESLDAVFLAGGFGNYINIENGITVGLLPGGLPHKIIPIGNSSGTGALASLLSEDFDAIAEAIRARTRYIELSTNEDFPLEFAMNMYFGLPAPN